MRMRGGTGLAENIAFVNLTYVESERGVWMLCMSWISHPGAEQTDSLRRVAPFNPSVHRSSFRSVHGNTERLGALVLVCSICRRNKVFFCLCIMHWARSDSEGVLLWCGDRESPPPQLRARKGRQADIHSELQWKRTEGNLWVYARTCGLQWNEKWSRGAGAQQNNECHG